MSHPPSSTIRPVGRVGGRSGVRRIPAGRFLVRIAGAAVLCTGTLAVAPAVAPSLGGVACAEAATASDGSWRVAVAVDPGALGGSAETICVTVPAGASGADVLAARASALGRPQPRYASNGLLCALDGQPATGCGERVDGAYRYWAYFLGSDAGWSYAGTGPALRRAATGLTEGWHFVAGAGNASDPAPRAASSPAATCPPVSQPAPTSPSPSVPAPSGGLNPVGGGSSGFANGGSGPSAEAPSGAAGGAIGAGAGAVDGSARTSAAEDGTTTNGDDAVVDGQGASGADERSDAESEGEAALALTGESEAGGGGAAAVVVVIAASAVIGGAALLRGQRRSGSQERP